MVLQPLQCLIEIVDMCLHFGKQFKSLWAHNSISTPLIIHKPMDNLSEQFRHQKMCFVPVSLTLVVNGTSIQLYVNSHIITASIQLSIWHHLRRFMAAVVGHWYVGKRLAQEVFMDLRSLQRRRRKSTRLEKD